MYVLCLCDNGPHPLTITTWQLGWLHKKKAASCMRVCVGVSVKENKINHVGSHPWPVFPCSQWLHKANQALIIDLVSHSCTMHKFFV